MDMERSNTRPLPHVIALLLILLWASAFRVATLNRPFPYDSEGFGSFYGVLAHNYLRFGWAETYGMPVLTIGRLPNAPITFYPDHPPVVPLLIVPFYKAFGFGEWQTRLATSIADIAAILALYAMLARFATRRGALLSAAMFAATPMSLYFGGQPEVTGMPLVLLAICSVFAYSVFYERPDFRNLVILSGAFTSAGATDWPAFVLAPIFLVHFVATKPCRQWIWIFTFCFIVMAVFVLLYTYIKFATGVDWDWMLGPFLKRGGLGTKSEFTAAEWLSTAVSFNANLHTVPLLLGSVAWILTLSWRNRPGGTIARLLLAWGIVHVSIGRQGAYIHEWWWWPLTPGIVTASGLWLDWFLEKTETRFKPAAVRVAAAIVLFIFTACTTQATYSRLYPAKVTYPFTTEELGEAIQVAAPNPENVAILVWNNNPQDYFYGNRPLKTNVWSIEDLQRRLWDDTVDLPFRFEQRWSAPATGIVFPLMLRDDLSQVLQYLQLRYREISLPQKLTTKFRVFDLCRAPIVF